MAGAAPQSLADDLVSGVEALSCVSLLPHVMLVHVLCMVPQDARARAACVCRAWRDAAADPALLATLWLDDSSEGKMSDGELSRLCELAGATLRELRLDVPACAASIDGVIAALRAGGCVGVQRLALLTARGNSASAAQAQLLAAVCPALEYSKCLVHCDSAEDVAAVCARLPGPLKLRVADGSAVRAMLQLPAQVAELETLCYALDAACVAALCKALRRNTTLTTLTLAYTGIGAVGAAALGEALRSNVTLRALMLLGNRIGSEGAASLGAALRTNATLTTLRLWLDNIGDAGAASLGNALRANATLTTLDLQGNAIGDAGAAALGEALRTNTTLTTLTFNRRNIVGAGRG